MCVSALDTSYGLNDPVSRRAIRTLSWTTGIGCAALVLKTGRQRRAAAERAAHRSQRLQDREGSRYSCRARSGGLCWSFTAIWLPDQRRGTARRNYRKSSRRPAKDFSRARAKFNLARGDRHPAHDAIALLGAPQCPHRCSSDKSTQRGRWSGCGTTGRTLLA